LTVTVEPASAVPVITMPSRSLSRVDRVVAPPSPTPVIATVVPRSTVRVWVAVAVLPAASVDVTVTASGPIRRLASRDRRRVGAVRSNRRGTPLTVTVEPASACP
jgi:hypothetical protein